jgi:hypothetical protein
MLFLRRIALPTVVDLDVLLFVFVLALLIKSVSLILLSLVGLVLWSELNMSC